MIEQILTTDTDLFLYLNNIHNSFFDVIMRYVSAKLTWVPLYLVVVFFIFKKFKLKKGLLIFVLIVLAITIADQTSVHLFKNIFQRLRPCFNPSIKNIVHTLSLPGGQYGFVSSHAANSFGFAIFSLFVFRNRYYTIFILFWAAIVSYSRIYLGVHYPLDIIGGALLGGFISYFLFTLTKRFISSS